MRRRDPVPVPEAAPLADLLHHGRPGFVELVAARRSADGRLEGFRRGNFVRAGRHEDLLAVLHALRGRRVELFFTPATLSRRVPGNDSVSDLSVSWVDIDDPAHLADLRSFPHRPHAVVASGSGGAHAYWLLAEPLSGARGESLNRRLAGASAVISPRPIGVASCAYPEASTSRGRAPGASPGAVA